MNTRDIATLPSETTEKILKAIPFYKAVKKQNEGQYQELLQYSRIFQFNSNEQILTRGQMDSWSYFLVKGQLVVSLPDQYGRQLHVNYITPGEVFGDLAVLLKTPRTADVLVDENCREAIVFGTDFSMFGQLLNFNIVSMETKLIYYRHTVQTLRWKLEMYRSKYRENELADQHRVIKIYSGPKNGMDELHALYQHQFGNLSVAEGKVPEPNIAI